MSREEFTYTEYKLKAETCFHLRKQLKLPMRLFPRGPVSFYENRNGKKKRLYLQVPEHENKDGFWTNTVGMKVV